MRGIHPIQLCILIWLVFFRFKRERCPVYLASGDTDGGPAILSPSERSEVTIIGLCAFGSVARTKGPSALVSSAWTLRELALKKGLWAFAWVARTKAPAGALLDEGPGAGIAAPMYVALAGEKAVGELEAAPLRVEADGRLGC